MTTQESTSPQGFTVEQRYSLLAAADPAELTNLADRILATTGDIQVLQGPETASTAIRYPLPGTQTSTAVLGHVVLTECSVMLAGYRGDGIRAGRDLEGAVAAAVCDAEVERSGTYAQDVTELCSQTLTTRRAYEAERATIIEHTQIGESA